MDSLYIFALIGLLHCFLYFVHTILLLYCVPYTNILSSFQLEIELLRFKWYTTYFNQTIKRWSKNRKRFWHTWFDVGVCITVVIFPLSVFILLQMTVNVVMHQTSLLDGDNSTQVLQLVVPGVDIPMNEVAYYIIALLVSTTFHEMGHALSAASEDVRLYGLGLTVFFIIPVAYVQLSNEQLLLSSMRSQLRILCAGVWHNLVLTMVAIIFLNFGPWLYKPFFSTETGVFIRLILPNSPLIGPTGLMIHDTVYKINDCSVRNIQEWNNCIVQTIREPNPGYCASEDFLRKYDNKVFVKPSSSKFFDCCNDKVKQQDHLCFKFLRTLKDVNVTKYSCLPARIVITQSHHSCVSNAECVGKFNYCLKPLLENITKVVKIKRLNKDDVLFIGYPAEIFHTVLVSNWVSKYAFLSSEFPETIDLICKYIVMFSSGLAIINVIPCFYFDGQYIVDILINLLLKHTISLQRFHRVISLSIKVAGTLLLSFNILCMLANKISY